MYQNQQTQKAADFAEELKQNLSPDGTFDSVAANDAIVEINNGRGIKAPDSIKEVYDEVGADASLKVTKAILDGMSAYEDKHGVAAPGDVVEYALGMAYATSDTAKKRYSLDAVSSSEHGENLSLQPNRAIVAILNALGEAIPFAHYLPADIGSNEAKLAILSHQAAGKYGAYEAQGLMDGVLSGDNYISSSRLHATANANGAHTGQLTSVQATHDTCAATGGDVVAVNLLRGRSVVYVNGMLVAREINSTGSGNSTVSGSVVVSGTTHQIGGTINTDTGVIDITSTPALSDVIPVVVEGFIDYERQPGLTPSIITAVETFPLFAKPWRVLTSQTIDTRTQMANELGLDPYSESIIAIQAQFGNERHYEVIHKAVRLAVNNPGAFDFDWTVQGVQKTRAQIWQDFASILGAVSQQMAIDTIGFGVKFLYVGANVASQMLSLPREIFTPSGKNESASIYRVGRLFGRYEVYYTPKGLSDSPSSSQILCIGMANDVTRNPFVLGDAVPPTVLPVAMGTDMNQGAAFYARNFTEINPYAPSALGCAIIDITNMGL